MCSSHSALLAAVVAALLLPPAEAQLSYVDRSTGLQTPAMEGGNTELEFGDLNGDGHVDIVSIGDHGSPYINTSEHGIMVWFGDGTGTWSVFQNGNFGYGGVALGDVNNDGLIDVGYGMHHDYASTDFGDQILEVALGDGTGRNWQPWDDGLATNGETWGMFGTDFADIDNDGDLDVGSVSFGCCNGVHVYRNNGDGTWTQTFATAGGNSAMVFVFGDVNGDGLADFAAALGSDNDTVYLGDGSGGFSPADGNVPLPPWGGRKGVALGDVNSDGRDDLAFVNANGGLSVWTWVGPGTWTNLSGNLPISGDYTFTQIADMDLDGIGDLVALAGGEPGHIVVYGGDGAGRWTQVAWVTTPNDCGTLAFRAGVDADHNGYPDMAAVAEENCQLWTGGVNRPRFYAESSTPSTTWIQPKYPRGGETFYAGSVRFCDWHGAEAGATLHTVMIELSLSGSNGPWTTLAAAVPNNGRYQWRLPAGLPNSANCYLRYTLDQSTALAGPFNIVGGTAYAPGDLDCSGAVDTDDISPFVLALIDPVGYAASYPNCDVNLADVSGDGSINGLDVSSFAAALLAD